MSLTANDIITFFTREKICGDAILLNEYSTLFSHISADSDGNVIVGLNKPIGICSVSGGYVFPSDVDGYAGYSPEIGANVFEVEFERIIPDTTLFDDDNYILWDTIKQEPIEYKLAIYTATQIVELMNDGFILNKDNEEFARLNDLPSHWKRNIYLQLKKLNDN